jgi:hypothetical protein
MNFEDQLRRALTRDPAPADFKRKLMARVAKRVRWNRRVLLAFAAALLIAAAVPATVVVRGIRARNQLLNALSVTQSTFRHTKELIHHNARRS